MIPAVPTTEELDQIRADRGLVWVDRILLAQEFSGLLQDPGSRDEGNRRRPSLEGP